MTFGRNVSEKVSSLIVLTCNPSRAFTPTALNIMCCICVSTECITAKAIYQYMYNWFVSVQTDIGYSALFGFQVAAAEAVRAIDL